MDQNTAVIVDNFNGAAGKTSGRLYKELSTGLDGRPADLEEPGDT